MASSFNVADLAEYIDLDKQSLLSKRRKLFRQTRREVDV